MSILKKIRNTEAVITIVGLGYVGLPTAAIFAKKGFKVIGTDINIQIIELLSKGECHIKEKDVCGIIKNAIKDGKLYITSDVGKAVTQSDVVIICVQTPLSEDKKPDLAYLINACEEVAKRIRKNTLVVIESTVPPGTIKNFVVSIIEKHSGLKCGIDFWLCYSPERITPSNSIRELEQNDRIIGGYDEKSGFIAAELYRKVSRGNITISDCTTAEVSKLAENTFRDVNIAFANTLALLCEELSVDVMEVVRLANTHPRVNIHQPGCGVGGPCLPKDPYFLILNREKYSTIIEMSRELNNSMAKHAVESILDMLKENNVDIAQSKIACLGVAYKGNVDDVRKSPAGEIIRSLLNKGAKVVVYDPYCDETFGAERADDIMVALKEADCVAILTDHDEFKKMDLQKIANIMRIKLLFDGRRIIKPEDALNASLKYVGIGFKAKQA